MTAGSLTTMPRFLTNTMMLAVPKSIAMSLPNQLAKKNEWEWDCFGTFPCCLVFFFLNIDPNNVCT